MELFVNLQKTTGHERTRSAVCQYAFDIEHDDKSRNTIQ